MILWLFWPGLNASFAERDGQHRAILNSYYSLAASAVVTFSIISFLEEKFRWSKVMKDGLLMLNKNQVLPYHFMLQVYIQNSALAGGVAIGTAADMMIQPFAAVVIGVLAAVVTIFGSLIIAVRLYSLSPSKSCVQLSSIWFLAVDASKTWHKRSLRCAQLAWPFRNSGKFCRRDRSSSSYRSRLPFQVRLWLSFRRGLIFQNY